MFTVYGANKMAKWIKLLATKPDDQEFNSQGSNGRQQMLIPKSCPLFST